MQESKSCYLARRNLNAHEIKVFDYYEFRVQRAEFALSAGFILFVFFF